MKFISQYNDTIIKVLGNQPFDINKKYRLASHCHMVDYEGKVILYNNLTKKLYELEKEEKELLSSDIEKSESIQEYVNDWILVPYECDEMKIATQLKKVLTIREIRDRIGHTFIIFTTSDCNARCYYCFEHGFKKMHMSDKTANDVADYIIRKSKNDPIYLKWFGGEPLYNHEVIDIITSKINNVNISFTSSITTNGYLFDGNIISKAVNDWRVKNVMITLDGTEEVYNKTKNYIYKNDISPFKKVINNIHNLIDSGITVTIRLNLSKENFEDLKALIEYLKERFSGKKLFVFAIPLYDLKHNRTIEENLNLYNKYIELEKMLVQNKMWGYNLKEFSRMGGGCVAENDFAETITPTGLLGKCEHFIEGERMFGSIYNEDVNIEAKNYYKSRKIIEKCKTCPLFPTCGGVTNCPTDDEQCSNIGNMLRLYTLERTMIADYKKLKNKDNSVSFDKVRGRYDS